MSIENTFRRSTAASNNSATTDGNDTRIIKNLRDLEGIEKSLETLDKKLEELGKKDKDYERLMTVPGVGVITALTYKVVLDGPERFTTSEVVGAYMGLTPRQYASGETDRNGSISKMGPEECRTMLYEAAQTLLTRVKQKGKLKS